MDDFDWNIPSQNGDTTCLASSPDNAMLSSPQLSVIAPTLFIPSTHGVPSHDDSIDIEDLMIDTSSKQAQTTPTNVLFGVPRTKHPTHTNQILFNQLPFLSSFKPKYTKRENIDKKILRCFRKYLYDLSKVVTLYPSINESSFYIRFINKELFPPLTYVHPVSQEKITFKSFNSNFLLWFFSVPGIKEYYTKFTQEQSPVHELAHYYELNDHDTNQLKNYINNLPFIFDNSLVTTIAGSQGYKCGHLYRKKTKHVGRDVDVNPSQNERDDNMEVDNDVMDGNENENDNNVWCNNNNNINRDVDSVNASTQWGDEI